MLPWAHEGSRGFCMLCFTVQRGGWRGFGHFTQHILSSNTLVFFPCFAKFFSVSKLGLWLGEYVPGTLGSAGRSGGTAEEHMASNRDFLLSLSPRIAGAVSLEHPPRASLNCIQLQWPLMGIVHHSGQQRQHRSQPQLPNPRAGLWPSPGAGGIIISPNILLNAVLSQ